MRRAVSSAVVDVVGMVIVGGGKDVVDSIVVTMIMKVNSEGDRVVIRIGYARRKMGSERVLTITRGWNNIDEKSDLQKQHESHIADEQSLVICPAFEAYPVCTANSCCSRT